VAVSRDTATSWDATTGANFPLWAQAIEDKLVAVGCEVVADSGDTVPSAMVLPGAADTSAGYRIYRDPGTPDMYFKVEYHRGDAVTELRLNNIIVGTGSDGAGTITNPWTTLSSSTSGGNDSASRLIHACRVDGELLLVATPDQSASSGGFMLLISRVRDRDGVYTGEVIAGGSLGAVAVQAMKWTGAAWAAKPLFWNQASQTAADGAFGVTTLHMNDCARPIRSIAWILGTACAQNDSGNLVMDGGETMAFIATGHGSGSVMSTTPPTSAIAFSGTGGATSRMLLRNE
jgi:hypothetical protein